MKNMIVANPFVKNEGNAEKEMTKSRKKINIRLTIILKVPNKRIALYLFGR
jgi:hypothetical protein